MALTREEVRKVALLARLELEEAEIDRQMIHINRLLQQFEKLKELDVSNVEPTSHTIPIYNVFRDDSARPSLPREEVLANAPESRNGCIVVPRILEG